MLFCSPRIKNLAYHQPYIQLGFFFLIRPFIAFSKQV